MSNAWEYGKLFQHADEFLKWLDGVSLTHTITSCWVHHTWKPSHKDFKGDNQRKLQDGMRSAHLQRDFGDIAQHITIFPDGTIMTGRPINSRPCSATGYNGTPTAHPFMFEMIGNFDKGNDLLEGKQLESAVKVCRYWYQKGKPTMFHREGLINGKAPKTCPGTGVDKEAFLSLVKLTVKHNDQPKPTTQPSAVHKDGTVYVVVKGDTLFGIAKKYGVSVKDLIALNKGIQPDNLQIGDHIVVAKTKVQPAPKKAKYELPKPVLKKGSKGDGVKQLQTALNALDFICGNADGDFGLKTLDALKRFQKVYCNPADGVFGDKTYQAMKTELTRRFV